MCGRMASVLIPAGGGEHAHGQSACRYEMQALGLAAALLPLPLKC